MDPGFLIQVQILCLFFWFSQKRFYLCKASFPTCKPLCHVQGLHLFVLDNFRRRDQCIKAAQEVERKVMSG